MDIQDMPYSRQGCAVRTKIRPILLISMYNKIDTGPSENGCLVQHVS